MESVASAQQQRQQQMMMGLLQSLSLSRSLSQSLLQPQPQLLFWHRPKKGRSMVVKLVDLLLTLAEQVLHLLLQPLLLFMIYPSLYIIWRGKPLW